MTTAGGGVPHVNYDQAMANTEPGGETSNFDIQSVSRVGQILSLFGPRTVELTAADIAERVGLNRTTAYRYAMSMVTAGILERGTRKGAFTLGGLLLQLGIHALHRKRVVDIAPGYLDELARTSGATAVLSLWGIDTPVVALVQEDPARTVHVTVRPGTQLDLSASQTRVFLAHLTDHLTVERMMETLPAPQRAELEAAIYTARRTGYYVSKLPDGIYGAAAPVFDEHGICATVALLGSELGVDLSSGSPLLSALTSTAAALGAELAGREGAPNAQLRRAAE
jgi:DNA-binding IclR family transcriptional regulator